MGLMDRLRNENGSEEQKLPEQILWLNDAPLFIDEKQVEALYDAVLQPDYEEISRNFSESISSETAIEGGLTLGAALPWLAKAEAVAKGARKKGRGEERSAAWNRVVNPYRHLLALALQYATQEKLKERLVMGGTEPCRNAIGEKVDLSAKDFLSRSPRAMVMLDLPPETPLIPAALELSTGKVVRLYEDLAKRLEHPRKEPAPDYPPDSAPEVQPRRIKYWKWFEEAYDRRVALEVVEDAVENATIAWIAYRIPLEGRYPHLQVVGRCKYETGVFAYQLISRGFEHGFRLIGTLKVEPGVNVLAIFER